MARRMTHALAATIFFLLLLGISMGAAAEEKTVEAEGVGAIISGDSTRARDEALRDAYRRAVETVGVYIDAKTAMQDFQILFDSVTTQSTGYVKNFIIKKEWSTNDGVYHILLHATVATGYIKNDFAALATLIDLMGNPVVMVLMREENMGRPIRASQTEGELVKQLTTAKYHLVDPGQLEAIKQSDMARKVLAGDTAAAATLGERFGADIIITGDVSTTEIGRRSTGNFNFVSANAYANIKAISSRTAKIIWADNPQATGVDLSSDSAGVKAIKELASPLASKLVWELPGKYSPDSGRSIQVIVSGLTYTQSKQALNAIKTLRGVNSANMRTFENGIAVIDAETTGNSDDLATRLEAMTDIRFMVTAVSADKVEVKINH